MDESEAEIPADEFDEPAVHVTAGRAGERSYRLIIPVKVDGKWLRTVRMRLPSQADIDDWGNGAIASNRAFLCRLTGLDPAVVKALRWPDSEALHQLFRDVVPEFVTMAGDKS